MGEGRQGAVRRAGIFWMEMGFRTKAKIELCVIRQIFEVKGRFGEAAGQPAADLGRANLNAKRLNEP